MQWFFIFRIVLPYVQKYIAGYVANYLEGRRAQRILQAEMAVRPAECPPCPPCPALDSPTAAGNSRKIWYGASGVMLGSALGLIGYLLWRPVKTGP